MDLYDVVIIGAGTGGCMTAKTLAVAGYRVCLIDRKNKRLIGKKTCGDAIGKHHFDNLGLTYPSREEKEREISGIKVYSPNLKTIFSLMGKGIEGFMVNRYIFGQRMLKNAIDEGSELFDSIHVKEPIIEKGYVKGIRGKNLVDNSKIELRGEVIVDASGINSVIRSRLPPEFGIDSRVLKEDQIVCYREIRELKYSMEQHDFCEIYINLKIAPGAYYWIFPERGNKVNVGLGVAMIGDYPNPKEQLYKWVLSRSEFDSSSIIDGGGGIVPTRRPLDSFVGNGIVIVGDSACQVNPIHGGGIGPSMISGKIAGEVIKKTLETGKPNRESLWPINIHYMKNYGAKQAGLDAFRIFLQGLTNYDLNYGMSYQIIKEEDVLRASLGGEIRLNITDTTKRIFSGLGRISFLRSLYNMSKTVKKVKIHYNEYPEYSKDIIEWKAKTKEIFKKAKQQNTRTI
jgi:geranylgeranyl reductase family protein